MKLQSTVIINNQIKLVFDDFEVVLNKDCMSNDMRINTIEELLTKLGAK